jgi:signal transduction histidine kinase/CheY-like chemotaxis protein
MSEPDNKLADHLDRERFLSVLSDITLAALEINDVHELTQLLADRLAEIINADGCFIAFWQEETQTALPAAAYGPLRDSYRLITTSPGEPTITRATVEADQTLVIEDAWNSGYASPDITRQFPSRSMLSIPLKTAERMLGAAMISFDEPHHFSDIEIEYCEQAVRQVSLALANVLALSALKRSELEYKELTTELQKREQHFEEAQRNAKMGSWEQGTEAGTTVWSPGMFELFDLPVANRPPGRSELLDNIASHHRDYVRGIIGIPDPNQPIPPFEFQTIHGKHLQGKAFLDETTGRIAGTLHDVTDQRMLEAQLFQARKMEAVGTLAGGIAHNFNNILTAIMGNYELLSHSIPADSNERHILDQCFTATERAALLTRQLLVFSRKHELNPKSVNVNRLITNLITLLSPLIGEHIQFSATLTPEDLYINADIGHLEQVIMNLVLNARDALSGSGTLSISTERRHRAAPYVAISVTDNGAGIAEEDLPHIFDPFFTNKEEGKGTGLGLATVQSIVHQSHGDIEVNSRVGEGTRITILLPEITGVSATDQDETSVAVSEPEEPMPVSDATILLVEDHESLRNIATLVLENAGYRVISVEDGEAAFTAIEDGAHVDLLLTDMQLPGGVSGLEISARLTPANDIPTIFMSGLREPIPAGANKHFLPKPFRPKELLALVNQALQAASLD